jgi:hypothetical protein
MVDVIWRCTAQSTGRCCARKNADLAVAGMTLKQARLQAELTENQQKPRVNSTVSTGHQFDFKLRQ